MQKEYKMCLMLTPCALFLVLISIKDFIIFLNSKKNKISQHDINKYINKNIDNNPNGLISLGSVKLIISVNKIIVPKPIIKLTVMVFA